MTPLRLSIIVIAGLLFAISLTLLGLVSHEFVYINSSTTIHARTVFTKESEYEDWPETLRTFASLPGTLNYGSLGLMIAAGCGGILDSILIIALAFRYKPFRLNCFGRKATIFGSLIVMAGLSLLRILIDIAAIVFGFVENSNSSMFDINARTEGDSVYTSASHFTIEAFSCALEKYAPEQKKRTFGQICAEGRAARWILVPMIVLSVGLLLLTLLALKREKIRDEHVKLVDLRKSAEV